MPNLYLFNKPFNVLCQFTDTENRTTLADYIHVSGIYPAGRLDYDSEGLLALTSDGEMQARIADPKFKLSKTYWVQVEGNISNEALDKLEKGVLLKDGLTKPAKARRMNEPNIWPRNPPIRHRKNDQTSWIEITISEGKNRQVRRMTAEVGFPTLRLIRYSIGPWSIDGIDLGKLKPIDVHLPKKKTNKTKQRPTNNRTNLNPKAKSKRKF